jgi:hypothetical protein
MWIESEQEVDLDLGPAIRSRLSPAVRRRRHDVRVLPQLDLSALRGRSRRAGLIA